MTTATASPAHNAWNQVIESIGRSQFDRLRVKNIAQFAHCLTYQHTDQGPTRGVDGLNRPYFTVQAVYNPEEGLPRSFALVMYRHNEEWKGYVMEDQGLEDDIFDHQEKLPIPDSPQEFYQKLFAGKYKEYQLKI
ncbi:MAG TPA: hypothetical protein PLO43_03525 [Chlamydiales bacterium]|nr:hypothetical protein [Chlamydiales bacterium]HPE85230.1 hypothetical protein [Chlamydiales bacterium]